MLDIFIKHYRVPENLVKRRKGPPKYCTDPALNRMKYSPYGGKTVCTVIDANTGHVVCTGISICSLSDRFDSQVGKLKAIWAARETFVTIHRDGDYAREWNDAVNRLYMRRRQPKERPEFDRHHRETTEFDGDPNRTIATPALRVTGIVLGGMPVIEDADWAGINEVAKKVASMIPVTVQEEKPKKRGRKSKKKEV